MYQLAPNIELLFADAGPDAADRVRAAAAAGFEVVEMWGTSGKDVANLARVLADTGLSVATTVAEPFTSFTFPDTDLTAFFDGLARGVDDARTLGSPRIVVTCGVGFPGMNRQKNLDLLIRGLSDAIDRTRGSGVKIIIEPINTRIDHPGALLDRTADAVHIARSINQPDAFGILYDLYHSLVNGEDPAEELAGAAGFVDYVEIADVSGRGEPGSGQVDWPAFLRTVRTSGYDGPIGLEFVPTGPISTSLQYIRSLAADA